MAISVRFSTTGRVTESFSGSAYGGTVVPIACYHNGIITDDLAVASCCFWSDWEATCLSIQMNLFEAAGAAC
jgi:hypothetical protein